MIAVTDMKILAFRQQEPRQQNAGRKSRYFGQLRLRWKGRAGDAGTLCSPVFHGRVPIRTKDGSIRLSFHGPLCSQLFRLGSPGRYQGCIHPIPDRPYLLLTLGALAKDRFSLWKSDTARPTLCGPSK
jgi:hypothetical protein